MVLCVKSELRTNLVKEDDDTHTQSAGLLEGWLKSKSERGRPIWDGNLQNLIASLTCRQQTASKNCKGWIPNK